MSSVSLSRKVAVSLGFLAFIVSAVSCTSKPILEKDDIKVTRDEPAKECRSLGPIEGRVATLKGTQEEAMENLKEEAIKKGADWVKIESIGAQGTTIRGQAYNCP